MKLKKIKDYLDNLLEIDKFKDEPDANGLLIKGEDNVKKIGFSVNTTFKVINSCIEKRIRLLIVHHPPWKDNDLNNYNKKMKLLKNNEISLYAVHDCLDCIKKIGISEALANEFGINIKGKFARWDFLPWGSKRKFLNKKAYVGVYGDKEITSDEFLKLIEKKLKVKPKYFIKNKKIKRIGIIGGGGLHSIWVKEAKELGCDTFLTGEGLFFGTLFGFESDVNIILASHYATEKPGVISLMNKIKKDLKILIQFIEDSNYG